MVLIKMVLRWSALSLGVAACAQGSTAPSQPPAPVQLESVHRRGVKADMAVSMCDAAGTGCTELREGTEIRGPAMVKTAPGAKATLRFSKDKTIEMSENSIILIKDSAAAQAIEIAEGTCLLKHLDSEYSGAAEKAGQERGEDTINNSKNLIVFASGTLFKAADDRETIVAIRVRKDETATVSVRKGTVLAQSHSMGLEFLSSGETARFAPGEALDRKAVWMGLDAPVDSPPDGLETLKAPVPRGLGTLTARIPGTTDAIAGVRLISHKVTVSVRDGYARTEVEEEFLNETPRVLEGRYAFPLPADASISRLALVVGDQWVEGEMVERKRAASIFHGIVEDTVRPRDPALLEWVSGGEFSLKIFPIAPKSSRKVLLAYNQALRSEGGRMRYTYPLSLGADRANTIDNFAISIRVSDSSPWIGDAMTEGLPAALKMEDGKLSALYSAESFSPNGDFHLSYSRGESEKAKQASLSADVAVYQPKEGEFSETGDKAAFAAIRLRAELPANMSPPSRVRRDVAVVIDKSHSQSRETLEGEVKLALGIIRQMDPDERYVVLACDSSCIAYPEAGTSEVNAKAFVKTKAWLEQIRPGGASDIAGALMDAANRLPQKGAAQVVYVGDGSPSAGELSAEAIAEMAYPALSDKSADLRLFGAGRTVDEMMFSALSRRLGAAYEAVLTDDSIENRINSISASLRTPVIQDAVLELPSCVRDVYPKVLPSLRLGQEIVLVGKTDSDVKGTLKLRGKLGNTDYEQAKTIELKSESLEKAGQNPLIPRLWAEARIRSLEESPTEETVSEIVGLSTRFHVMSRHTSLLVLENDRMFAEFGIRRTAKAADDRSDQAFMKEPERKRGNSSKDEQADTSSEPDAPDAVGHMFGAGGLGLSGIGEGGAGSGQGFGAGVGTMSGSHKTSPPKVRMGSTSVSGRLPPEIIQRIVRQNFGRFRLCYENGLRNNPNLAGRVTIRFLIGREGNVMSSTNGGSDLPDSGVIACVARSFLTLSFPQPESGTVTVTYPIMFSPGDGGGSGWSGAVSRPWQWSPPPFRPMWVRNPTVSHRVEADSSKAAGTPKIEALEKSLGESPNSRKRHENLIRGLLVQGRFYDALVKAQLFADLDPEMPLAQELLAFAAAAGGDADRSLSALDSMVELNPRKASAHLRAARGFEARGDERRACAHFRSAAFLTPKSVDALYEALRCRARVLDGAQAVASRIRNMANPDSKLSALLADLDAGKLKRYAFSDTKGAEVFAQVRCVERETGCPVAVVVAPSGTVYSPWTQASFGRGSDSKAISGVRISEGTYRTVLVGGDAGARAELEVSVLGSVKKLSADETQRTVSLLTSVSGLSTGFGGF